MQSVDVKILNKLGFHARPASMFVRIALKFSSDVYVMKDGEEASGKSIMGLMALAAAQGTELTLKAKGDDADEVLVELKALFEDKFGEPE